MQGYENGQSTLFNPIERSAEVKSESRAINTPNRKSNHFRQFPEGTPDGIALSKTDNIDGQKTIEETIWNRTEKSSKTSRRAE